MGSSFLDAYLVEAGGSVVGAVRRDRNVWRIYAFGIAVAQQPTRVFETRAAAGAYLVELVELVELVDDGEQVAAGADGG